MDYNELLPMMNWIIDRWINIPQRFSFLDREMEAKPHFMSLLYREVDKLAVRIKNGYRIMEPKVEMSGFASNILIGDKNQGYGCGRSARDEVPREIPAIRKSIDESVDRCLKVALSSYLMNLGKTLSIKKENGFYNQSDDPVHTFQSNDERLERIPTDIINMMKDWGKKANSLKHVLESDAAATCELEKMFFKDSEGRTIKDYILARRMTATIKIVHDKRFMVGYAKGLSAMSGWKAHSGEIMKKLDEMIETSFKLKEATVPVSNQYPVIFSGETIGTLFHEAMGAHLLSGKYIAEGTSTTFKGQIGKQVLPDFLTLIDNPQAQGAYGFYRYDDEGIEGQRVVLVENGILKNYLLDRDSAHDLKQKSNGHARSGWVMGFDEEADWSPVFPEPRVGNLEIISKKSIPDDELIEHMKKYCVDHKLECGLYIDGTIGGEVKLETGVFHLFPNIAWKIYQSGKKEYITNFIIVGNPYEHLKQIAVTGTTRDVTTGNCGADSGWVRTQELAPAAFLPKVSIQAIEPVCSTERLLERLPD